MVRPCSTTLRSTLFLGPTAFYILQECDKWAALHLIVPFLFTVYTRNAFFGWFIAFFGELLEYTAYTLLGSYGFFVTTNTDVLVQNTDLESLANIFVSDILIQGGLGALIGWLTIQTVSGPVLLAWNDLWKRPMRFWYYFILLFGITFATGATYDGVKVGSFRLGINLAWILLLVQTLIMIATSPKSTLYGFSKRQLAMWWAWWFVPVFIMHVQNQFDWFYSGPVQSWFVSGFWVLVIVVYGSIKWQWWRTIYFDYRFFY